MKKVHLIIQSKGGCGKSLLSWFLANLYNDDERVLFMDVDDSTRTSSERLGSILHEPKKRLFFYPLLNPDKKLERERFLECFEKIATMPYNEVFMDLGAPESDEFRKLLEFEISAQDLAQELKSLGIELIVFIVIGGRDAFGSCMRFYKSLSEMTEKFIDTRLVMNEGTFGGIEDIANAKQNIQANFNYAEILGFGNLGHSQSGKDIIKLIEYGKTPKELNLAGRMTFNKAIKQVEQIMKAVDVES